MQQETTSLESEYTFQYKKGVEKKCENIHVHLYLSCLSILSVSIYTIFKLAKLYSYKSSSPSLRHETHPPTLPVPLYSTLLLLFIQLIKLNYLFNFLVQYMFSVSLL